MIDLLIAGGGPVGLAAAIEARLLGLTVAVIEPRNAPIDKACGEGLMPGAVSLLAGLGVQPVGHPFAGIGYYQAAASRVPKVPVSLGVEHRFNRPHEPRWRSTHGRALSSHPAPVQTSMSIGR